jgi:hypothetical protein
MIPPTDLTELDQFISELPEPVRVNVDDLAKAQENLKANMDPYPKGRLVDEEM